ncbi:MAG TPA: DUF4870 domain-containing protein [Flavitalea sp.]|nr:DUF4870 domain-containing protein [Flavitalea sp.]
MNQQNTIFGTEEATVIPPTSDEKTLGMLAHILTIVASFIAPLVIYILKKDESSFVTAHAKESLNFQLTVIIAYFISWILVFILIGIPLLILVGLGSLILVIVATIRVSEGKMYRYPFCIRFIK